MSLSIELSFPVQQQSFILNSESLEMYMVCGYFCREGVAEWLYFVSVKVIKGRQVYMIQYNRKAMIKRKAAIIQ
jgi:hypothetical protein